MDASEMKKVMDDMDGRIERIAVRFTQLAEANQLIAVQFGVILITFARIREHLDGLEEPALTSREVNCD